jgi:hypothetical protein
MRKRRSNTKKKNKRINFELSPIVPDAISRGIIEGYTYPYIESTQIISEQICNINITNENDPISYNEEISQGSGLNAIKLLRFKNYM